MLVSLGPTDLSAFALFAANCFSLTGRLVLVASAMAKFLRIPISRSRGSLAPLACLQYTRLNCRVKPHLHTTQLIAAKKSGRSTHNGLSVFGRNGAAREQSAMAGGSC